MPKKLTAKTQYLNPTLPEETPAFAKAVYIEPENDETVLKRGVLYTIFDVRGGGDYNVNLITKVVNDVLYNSYFQSDNISPIQSLEKAISEVKDKIEHMANESIHTDQAPTEFSIIAGILWGNVMYVVQYGMAQSYLVRQGEIKPINTISEGSFSAASGVVKDGDVIIFCSQEFGKKYPPNTLLSMSIGENVLQPEEACILMKYMIDNTSNANEAIDFGLPDLPRKKSGPKVFSAIKDAVNKIRSKKVGAPKRASTVASIGTDSNPKPKPTVNSVSTLNTESGQNESTAAETRAKQRVYDFGTHTSSFGQNAGALGNSSSRGDTPLRMKLRPQNGTILQRISKPLFLIILIALALGISILFTIKNRKTTPEMKQEQATQQPPAPVVEGAETSKPEPDEEVFYDLKITDSNADPTQIAVFNSVVAVSDTTSGKIYSSDQNTAKFEAESTAFVGIKNLINIKGKLGFTDNEGYKVYDLAAKKVAESYKQPGLGITSAYLNFVYSISGSQLTRYSKTDATLTSSVWGQNEDFNGAKSMAVAYSVYVVTKDNNLVSFTGGTKDKFATKGTTLTNAGQVIADIDFENIYVVDNGRVVSFDDKGNFVKEYKPKREGAWDDIRSIGVSSDEKTLFVLNGSRVYKIAL